MRHLCSTEGWRPLCLSKNVGGLTKLGDGRVGLYIVALMWESSFCSHVHQAMRDSDSTRGCGDAWDAVRKRMDFNVPSLWTMGEKECLSAYCSMYLYVQVDIYAFQILGS